MQHDRCTRIYKYRSLSGEYGRKAIERVITYNQLYWQSPVGFNDPFDCFPVLYFGNDAAEQQDFLARAAALAGNNPPPAQLAQRPLAMGLMPTTEIEELYRNNWGKWLSATAISCFSELHDHPLMWGHYADSHKGVCLIFDEVANNELEWFAIPIAYQDARPRVNLTRFNDPNVMMQALFLKSAHWSYEREQRMIVWNGTPGYRNFPAQQLKGIILGAKITEDDEAFVRGLLANRPELRVLRAEVDAAEFKLNIVAA